MGLRQMFFQDKSRQETENEAPWAYKIVKVEGGYMAFESPDDYETWIKQQ